MPSTEWRTWLTNAISWQKEGRQGGGEGEGGGEGHTFSLRVNGPGSWDFRLLHVTGPGAPTQSHCGCQACRNRGVGIRAHLHPNASPDAQDFREGTDFIKGCDPKRQPDLSEQQGCGGERGTRAQGFEQWQILSHPQVPMTEQVGHKQGTQEGQPQGQIQPCCRGETDPAG